MDNSIQAGAGNVHVLAVCAEVDTGKRGRKPHVPKYLAVIDDGHGMPPKMLRHAIRWGGTHRENDRTGFGRFGYGLPSASVSQGRRFTVYSSLGDGEWFAAGLDIDLVTDKTYNREGRIVIPSETRKALPADIVDYMEKQIAAGTLSKDALDRGTVVVIDKLDPDRVESTVPEALEAHLLETFGITYRNYLRDHPMYVNGKRVEAIDPLFVTPGAWLYDFDLVDGKRELGVPGMKYDEIRAEVRDDLTGEVGEVVVRLSRLPAAFVGTMSKKSKRWKMWNDYSGLVVCRKGRQIDVVRALPREWRFKLGNNQRYVRFEIDFSPVLDRYFSVTTSKQQIVIKPKLLEVLTNDLNLGKVLRDMVAEYVKESKQAEEKTEQKSVTDPFTPRPSEKAIKEGERFNPRPPAPPTPAQVEQDKQVWKAVVDEEAVKTGLPPAVVEANLTVRVKSRQYEVKSESAPGGPFYRPLRVGGAVWLYLNTDHRFYKEVYRGPESSPRLRAVLELLLFVLATCETGAADPMLLEFYKKERGLWSTRFETALNLLNEVISVETAEEAKQAAADDAEAADETAEVAEVDGGTTDDAEVTDVGTPRRI